jgi:hypothetical protein
MERLSKTDPHGSTPLTNLEREPLMRNETEWLTGAIQHLARTKTLGRAIAADPSLTGRETVIVPADMLARVLGRIVTSTPDIMQCDQSADVGGMYACLRAQTVSALPDRWGPDTVETGLADDALTVLTMQWCPGCEDFTDALQPAPEAFARDRFAKHWNGREYCAECVGLLETRRHNS